MLRRIVQLHSHEYLRAGWRQQSFATAGLALDKDLKTLGMHFIESIPPIPNVNKAEMFAVGATAINRRAKVRRPTPNSYNVVVNFDDDEAVARFKFDRHKEVIEVYADLEIRPVLQSPYNGAKAVGSETDVATLLHRASLQQFGLSGAGVRVVIVDTGVDANYVNVEAEGWSPEDIPYEPGSADGKDPELGHGTMCAHDVGIVAPSAKIHDFALLRRTHGGMARFLSDALAAFSRLTDLVETTWDGQAVIVNNSWGVYNRTADLPIGTPGNYGANLNHPVNQQIGALASLGVDILFAAGNCGMPGPDGRCSSKDCGPGRSIHGANSHPDVMTVGGVTINRRRLAYSSQGPGTINSRKPDLAAYTHFSTGSAWSLHSGTSTASPVLAGVVAALRTLPAAKSLSPPSLKAVLQKTAQNPAGNGWNGDFGHGIVNVPGALKALGASVGTASPASVGSKKKSRSKARVNAKAPSKKRSAPTRVRKAAPKKGK